MTKPKEACPVRIRVERIDRLKRLIARAEGERGAFGHRGGRHAARFRESWILCWKRELRGLEKLEAAFVEKLSESERFRHEVTSRLGADQNPLGVESIEVLS